jgi:hypothetical protein
MMDVDEKYNDRRAISLLETGLAFSGLVGHGVLHPTRRTSYAQSGFFRNGQARFDRHRILVRRRLPRQADFQPGDL